MDKEALKQQADLIVEKLKVLVQEGNVARIILKRNGNVLLNLPLNAGIAGAVVGLAAAPCAVLTAALVSFGLDCEVEIEKIDGTILNLNETQVGTTLETAKHSIKEFVLGKFKKDADIPSEE